MTTTSNKIEWPTIDCTRCGGSGRFSYNTIDGDRCYGCNGTGRGFTKPVFEIVDEYRRGLKAAKHSDGESIAVGDRIYVEHEYGELRVKAEKTGRGRWFTVERIVVVDERMRIEFFDAAGDMAYAHPRGVVRTFADFPAAEFIARAEEAARWSRLTGTEFRDAHPGFGRRADLEPDAPRDDLGLRTSDGPAIVGYLDRVDAGTWPRFGYWQARLEAAGLVAVDDADALVVTDAGRTFRQEQAR